MRRPGAIGLLLAALVFGPCVAEVLPQEADPYFQRSADRLAVVRSMAPTGHRARNVILFIGDGMGPSTVTAARIQAGQQAGQDGASSELIFERLPYVALSKTYSHDQLVTDSAAGATGLMSGVKTANGVVGLDSRVKRGVCEGSASGRVSSLAEIARAAGLSAGVVTTTSLTDATPAGAYGHAADREWQDDAATPPAALAAGCVDLARQLVEAPDGARLDVALGGGRARFTPQAQGGRRQDGRDLLTQWRMSGPQARVVATAGELAALEPETANSLLGVFADENLKFHRDAGPDQPTLAQMTLAALEILRRNPKGYFLMVEGGLIDKASHLNNAARTLDEAAQFAEAIAAVLARVDMADTLVVVTADHSHGLVISGDASRDAPILGLAQVDGQPKLDAFGRAYSILSFATGPSAIGPPGAPPTQGEAMAADFRQPALVPLASAEHGGEDVAIYAGGPGADLVRGVVEQPYVFQVIRAALGL